MNTQTGSEWQERAVCVLETPDAPELWGPDRRPPMAVWVHLESMCERCPVRRDCAADAVARLAESGVYAGVWVPKRALAKSWLAALDKLQRIAGPEIADVGLDDISDQAIGVPA